MGDYFLFGRVEVSLPLGRAWLAHVGRRCRVDCWEVCSHG